MAMDQGVPRLVQQELEAGEDQTIVVYGPADMGIELDPFAIFGEIAEDAARRWVDGARVVSMTTMPLRHAGTFMGKEGSGYQTRVAIAVVYERTPRAGG